MEAMEQYYATSQAQQEELRDHLKDVKQQLQQLQNEHASCLSLRCALRF